MTWWRIAAAAAAASASAASMSEAGAPSGVKYCAARRSRRAASTYNNSNK